MRGIVEIRLPARQRGSVLLGLIGLFSMMVIFAYVSSLNQSAADIARARDRKTYAALALAKEALIAYAVTYADDATHAKLVPGFLPCPDEGPPANEGVAASPCGGTLVSQLGRLPWRTLGLGPITDGSGECLWYAVSGTYKSGPNGVTTSATTSNMMNWDANGQFNVMDANDTSYLAGSTTDPSTNAVAVIFAPGAPLSGQNRTTVAGTNACGGNYNPAAYLDSAKGINNNALVPPSSPGSVTDISRFIAGTSNSAINNDQLVYITRADIWNAIKKRSDFQNNLRALTRRAAECIAMYGTKNQVPVVNTIDTTDKRLPWASNVLLSNYVVNSTFSDTSGNLSGRLPYLVSVSVDPVLGTNNSLTPFPSPPYPPSSYYLFAPFPPAYCSYAQDPMSEQDWYDHWKDHLFYAVANNYRPSAVKPTAPCGTCLTINGSGNYAAVVIFAGEKLAGQNRNTLSDKKLISNYLEGRNASNHPNTLGNGDYQGALADSTFNDFVYAIDESLTVSCYDSAVRSPTITPSLTMQPARTAACP